MYYFEKQRIFFFVLGDGALWNPGFNSPEVGRVGMSVSYPSPDEIFIAGNQVGGEYAIKENNVLHIQNLNRSLSIIIPGQDDYRYKVAFSPQQMKMFALGSRYGSIHIWVP